MGGGNLFTELNFCNCKKDTESCTKYACGSWDSREYVPHQSVGHTWCQENAAYFQSVQSWLQILHIPARVHQIYCRIGGFRKSCSTKELYLFTEEDWHLNVVTGLYKSQWWVVEQSLRKLRLYIFRKVEEQCAKRQITKQTEASWKILGDKQVDKIKSHMDKIRKLEGNFWLRCKSWSLWCKLGFIYPEQPRKKKRTE